MVASTVTEPLDRVVLVEVYWYQIDDLQLPVSCTLEGAENMYSSLRRII